MTKSDAIKHLRTWEAGWRNIAGTAAADIAETAGLAAAALEREAARDEAERPKMTLAEMADAMTPFPTRCTHCGSPVARCCLERGRSRGQIASTLKRLAEEGGKIVQNFADASVLLPHQQMQHMAGVAALNLLKQLGCGATK